MPLDPQAKQLMDWTGAQYPPAHTMPVEEARRNFRERTRLTDGAPQQVARIEDRTIRGPQGDIPIRVYTPEGNETFPALMYFHGGGWVIGGLDTHQNLCCGLARQGRLVVVAVDYRLAPEHKFPRAAEDCYAATQWVAAHANEVRIDPLRIAVGGDSAGGNLAAAVCLMARDRRGPRLVFQLLIYPVMNHNFDTASYHEYATGYSLTREAMMYYWDQYLSAKEDGQNPYASPLRASDLRGMPPALIVTAEYDPLRDEGRAYAQKLQEAGVPVTLRHCETMIHGFLTMTGKIDEAKRIRQEIAQILRNTLCAQAAERMIAVEP
jgi:acetyl esterase